MRLLTPCIFALLPSLISCAGDPDDSGPADALSNTGGDGMMSTEATGGAGSGSTGSGGSATGGEGSATGGAATGGAGGSATGGESNQGTPPMPSPGCNKGGRPEGGKVYKAGESWLIFPEKYDGKTPLPVLVGFHGCGSYNAGDANRTEFWDLTRKSGFETDYIVAAPIATSGSCYDYGTDMPKAKALFTELVENYCVDLNRVFGTGHSYGAGGMLMSLTASSNSADFQHFNFKGIAPVSGWLIGSQSTKVPTMYIQGVTDSERGNSDGADVVAKIVQVNQCSSETTPYAVDACNTSGGAPVSAGCKTYVGCDVETIWCSHNDPDYGGTFHGVPCFYRQAVYDFFAGL